MMCKLFSVCLCLIGITTQLVHANGAKITKLYIEIEYTAHDEGLVYDTQFIERQVITGTGFLIKRESGPLLITARHVMAGPRVTTIKDLAGKTLGKGDYVTRATCRIRISGLAIKPTRIFLSESSDVAAFEVSKVDLDLLNLTTLTVKKETVRTDDRVQIWGYPSTSNPHSLDECIVSFSSRDLSYFVINQAVETGYSGGPCVLSRGNEVVGFISRSEGKQARVIKIAKVIDELVSADFSNYRDNMVIYTANQTK